MKQTVIRWLLSHAHAARMMKRLNAKKHAHMGFYYEYEDVGDLAKFMNVFHCVRATHRGDGSKVQVYANYHQYTTGGLLTVYRDVPHPDDVPADSAEEVKRWFCQSHVPLPRALATIGAARYIRRNLDEVPDDWKPAIMLLVELAELTLDTPTE